MNHILPSVPKRKKSIWSRRRFLALGFYTLLGIILDAWIKAFQNLQRRTSPVLTFYSSKLRYGTEIFHSVILVKERNEIQAYSARCPHLGCIIKRENDKLVCPCHGSQFDLKGKRLGGPAPTDLKPLEIVKVAPDTIQVRDI